MIIEQTAWHAHLIGGMLIGVASLLLMFSIGKIAGISSIVANTLGPRTIKSWQIFFLLGLLLPGLYLVANNELLFINVEKNTALLITAGLLVGIGTKLGNGCTSGHGICGIGRLSWRSIVATMTFMLSAIVTVFITQHII